MTLFQSTPGLAEVILENTVKKIESTVTSSGVVEQQLVAVDSVLPGDELRYTIRFSNQSTQAAEAGSIVITNPLPEGTRYIEGSAAGLDAVIVFSLDGKNFAPAGTLMLEAEGASVPADYRAIRWTFGPQLAAGESGSVSFDIRIQ
jgi:uncharacterized repeat protein (TIGR01451 family)